MPIVRKWLTSIAYAVLVTPLVFSVLFSSPYIFVQIHLIRAFAILVFIPLIYCWIFDERSRPRITGIDGSILAFGLGLIMINGFSINRQLSYMGVWERFGSVTDWVALIILFFTLRTIFTTQKEWHRYFIFHTITATIVALDGLAQVARLPFVFFEGTRIFSTLGNPAFMGAYLLLSIGIGVHCLRMVRYRTFIASSVVIQIIALLYTYTRSTLLGVSIALFIVAVIALWQTLIRRHGSHRMSIAFAMIGALIMGFGIFGIGIAYSIRPVFDTARPSEIVDQTTKSRIINTGIAAAGFMDKPVFGWGTGMYSVVFQKQYDPRLYYGSNHTTSFDRSHNEYLDKAVETGIVGLLFWLSMLISPFWYALQQRRSIRPYSVLLAFIGGYAAYLFFSFSSIADSILLMVILAFMASSHENDHFHANPNRLLQKRALQVITILLSVGLLFVTQLKTVTANLLVRSGEKAESLIQATRFFREASPLGITSKIRIVDAITSRITRYSHSDDTLPAYYFFERSLLELIPRMPYEVRYLAQLARVERILADRTPKKIDEAYSLANAAVELSPRDPQLYHLRGLIQLDRALTSIDETQRSVFRKAMVDDFATAYELAPHIHETAILYLAGTGFDQNDFGPLYDYIEKNGRSFRTSDWRLVLQAFDSFKQTVLFDRTIQQMRRLPTGTAESILSSLGIKSNADLSQ